MSTVEGFHCIQDTSPGPLCVHNRRVPEKYVHTLRPSGVFPASVVLHSEGWGLRAVHVCVRLEAVALVAGARHLGPCPVVGLRAREEGGTV